MEVLLLGIYSFFVWLIFIKFKLLPWTTPYKVAVAIIPVVGLMTLMLLLNVFAPTTDDVRVIKYHRARGLASSRTRDRSAGREQPAGEEGGCAVPHRSDAVSERGERDRSAPGVGQGETERGALQGQ